MSNINSPESFNWYYAQDGNPIGPVPFATLQALHKEGQISDESFVVEDGGQEWKTYGTLCIPSVPELPKPPSLPLPQASNPASRNDDSSSPTITKKKPTARDGCFGCLGSLLIVGFTLMLIDKCASFKDGTSKPNTSTSRNAVSILRGNVKLAQPYTMLGSLGGGPSANTIWIHSPNAETAAQRAATVYVAGNTIKNSIGGDGDFSVVLAIDTDLAGPIPNGSGHGLYTARATFNTKKFEDGNWQFIKHWEVFASNHPSTQESISVLSSIYVAASSRGLKWENDYFAFIAQTEKIPQESAEAKVWKAIHLGTPGQQYEFEN